MMKKKVLYLLLTTSMIMALAGCGAKEEVSAPATPEPEVVVEEVEETKEEVVVDEPELTVEELDAMIKEEFNNGDSNHNRDQVKEWCNQAIEMGSGYALYVMSSEYFMDEDYEKALELAQAAIDKKESGGYVMMAYCYQNGLGVEKDINKTIELANNAIENDIPWGYAKLGDIYTGNFGGVERDEAKMFENYKAYCDSATEDISYSYFEGLASCYQHGMGVEKDIDKAIEYYIIAADNGRPACYAVAASIYKANEDYDNAADLYAQYVASDFDFEQLASDDIFLDAGFAMYKIGNMEMAKMCWEKSIELGEPGANTAQKNLDSVQ